MSAKSVFLVEDNPDDRTLASRALKRIRPGCEPDIREARDGQEALDRLLGGAENPDLILLDINLPRVNGLDVLQRLREEPKTRFIPVVIMSTSEEEEDLIAAYSNGANSYVRKPVSYDRYAEAVQKVACYWLGLNVAVPE